tara:strand:+ start:501 stop:623 length:123 start_codon:yes stop_codon:yes gene_type:complete
MIGWKKDTDRQDVDKIFRKKYGIELYYKKMIIMTNILMLL